MEEETQFFFHAHVSGKIKKLHIKRIKDQQGVWLEQEPEIFKKLLDSVGSNSQKNRF